MENISSAIPLVPWLHVIGLYRWIEWTVNDVQRGKERKGPKEQKQQKQQRSWGTDSISRLDTPYFGSLSLNIARSRMRPRNFPGRLIKRG
ncbi:unnamed protein product [Penicillium roqueforti FM164]|uniref:Uncharacterized protein n=1 Tax=Penicillium roqueforti (strain FM164) TaxID=1365484 RepID=W6QMG4_PENRF|nr:unnamed protein product [Penicillium roqueforti FM164]